MIELGSGVSRWGYRLQDYRESDGDTCSRITSKSDGDKGSRTTGKVMEIQAQGPQVKC